MAKRKQIGRGVASILGNINLDTEVEQEKEQVVKTLASMVAMLPIEQIEAYKDQPRQEFEEVALQELSESIKVHGLIQPITVRRIGENQYQLISGERRLRASKLAELTEIPAYVRVANDQEMLEMALVENIQREDLNPIEVATTYERLMEECNLTHKLLAQRVGKTRSSVTNYLRLLKLPPQVKTGLQEQALSMGHARALAGMDNSPLQVLLFNTITNEGMSVRQVEAITRDLSKLPPSILVSLTAEKIELGHATVLAELNDPALQLSLHREILEKGLSVLQLQVFVNRQKQKAEEKDKPQPPKKERLSFEFQKMQDTLSHRFQTKVAIKRSDSNGKGQIVLNFDSDEDFNRLLDLIEGE
jgi:ParB family chromosome partitioning protein